MFPADIIDVYTDVYKGKHTEEEIADPLAQAELMIDAVCETSFITEDNELWYQLAVCAQADHIADTERNAAAGASADGRLSRISLGDYSCSYTYSAGSSSGTGAAPSAVCRSGGYISLGALAFLDKAGLISRACGVR